MRHHAGTPEREDSSDDNHFTGELPVKTTKVKKPTKKADSKRDTKSKDNKKIPGNGNFAKATRNRVKGRDDIPDDELEEFDSIKTTELREELKKRGYKVGATNSKVELWCLLKGREDGAEKLARISSTKNDKAKTKTPKTVKKKERKEEKPKKAKIPGNGNFAKASQRRATGRDTIPEDELEEFDKTKLTDLKERLKTLGLKTTGRKLELWLRWKEVDAKDANDADDADAAEPSDIESDTEDEELDPQDDVDDVDDWDATKDSDEDAPWYEKFDPALRGPIDEARDALMRASILKKKKEEGERNITFRPDSYDKGKRPSSSKSGQASSKRPRIQGEGDDVKGKEEPSGLPTDFYIDQRFLDMTLAEVLKAVPEIPSGTAPPRDINMTFRQYLLEHFEYRRDIAQLKARGTTLFGDLSENIAKHGRKRYIVLQPGFIRRSFVEALDETPYILQLWEELIESGYDELWHNRYNHPRLSKFHSSLLNGRNFLETVVEYPNFAHFLNEAIDSQRLIIMDATDSQGLQLVSDRWIIEEEARERAAKGK